MASRHLYGQTYDEIAIVAAVPIPVDIGGSSITFTGNISVGAVTVNNTNASPVPVSDAGGSITVDTAAGALSVTGPLTLAQLTGSTVSVANLPSTSLAVNDNGGLLSVDDGGGSITVDTAGGPLSVSGPLTDTQLRATAVPVSGPLTDTQLRATAVPVSGPLTDTQLRATAVPVSGPLTDTQLRATAVPVVGSAPTRTPTTASVTGSAASVLVLAANASRRGLMVSNQSASKLYLSFATPASQANSFIEVQPSAFLLLDQQLIATNAIYGIWTNANGTCQVTEFV
jgi:hypothetical protein